MAKQVDIIDRFKKIEASLNEANRIDRFDEKIKNITPTQRNVMDEILNIEIDDDNGVVEQPSQNKNRVAKGIHRDSEADI